MMNPRIRNNSSLIRVQKLDNDEPVSQRSVRGKFPSINMVAVTNDTAATLAFSPTLPNPD